MPQRPHEMYTANRLKVPDFDPAENLFVRVEPDQVINGEVKITAIRLPEQSVNRERFSPPWWVLIPSPEQPAEKFRDCSVFAIARSDVPSKVEVSPGVDHVFEFRVAHVPVENNYAHSEIGVFRGGHQQRKIKNKSAKQMLRYAVCAGLSPVSDAPHAELEHWLDT